MPVTSQYPRYNPRTRVIMWQRTQRVPDTWRVVDFRGPGHMGRELPAYSTRQMELLRLVLDAGDIPFIITGHGSQTRAFVPSMYENIAREELASVIGEKNDPVIPAPVHRNAHLIMLIMLFLIFWHGLRMGWWPLPFEHIPDPDYWLQCGRLDVALVRGGEWWRTATALTLHADSLHLFSNVVFGTPFLILLGRRLGMGLTLFGILCSGMLGNALNVIYHDPGYASIGFSTAMFGSTGVLCASISLHNHGRSLKNGVLPLAAGLALLALLGTEGENIDYAAHVFGLLAGLTVGFALCLAMRYKSFRSRRMEYATGALALLMLFLCWSMALSPVL